MKIKTGDEVLVIAGKDKGVKGTVIAVLEDANKVIVEGVNVVKKHVRPNPMKGVQGGIVDKTMPVDISNVAIYNSETKKADRVGFRFEDGKKVRFFKSNNEKI